MSTSRVAAALLLAGCINPTTIVPSQSVTPAVGRHAPPSPSLQALDGELAGTIALYNQHPGKSRTFDKLAVFPESGSLRTLGGGMATMGFFAIDLGQSVLDQQDKPWTLSRQRAWHPLTPPLCDQATPSNADEILAFGADDVGNPPEPNGAGIWIPVARDPRHPPPEIDPAACEHPDRAGDVLCVFGRLALQPARADLIIVVPGLLHSSAHHYVRETAAVLYSLGYSVLSVDMRDHGETFHARMEVPSTLGLFEGQDLVAIGERIRGDAGCGGRVGRVGILGYSAGGTFALEAFLADRERHGDKLTFDAGVLAIAPILDLGATLKRMSWTRGDGSAEPCGLVSTLNFGSTTIRGENACINVSAIAYYFMELLRLRLETLHGHFANAPGVAANKSVSPERYIDWILAQYQGSIPRPPVELTPARLAGRFKHIAAAAPSTQPFAALVSSTDDPVVGADPRDQFRDAVGRCAFDHGALAANDAPVCVYTPEVGGHTAFPVVSSPLSRHFVRSYFEAFRSIGAR